MSLFWLCLVSLAIIAIAFALRWRGSRAATGRLRLEGGSMFYDHSVTAEEAGRAGRYLVEKGLFKAGLVGARFYRDGATYQLLLVCSSGKQDEEQYAASEVLAAGFSDEVVSGAAVAVQICDGFFRPTAVIRHRGRFGRRIGMNAASLFYMDGVTEDEAGRVALFLAHAGLFNHSSKIAQLNRAGDGFEFRLAVEVDPLPSGMIEGQHQMASDLSSKVLGGRPISVQYSHGLMSTLRVEPAGQEIDHDDEKTIPKGQSYHTQIFDLQ